MRCTETIVTTTDANPLFVRQYGPERDVPRTLVVVHGLSEHGERYAHVARWLVEQDWNVVIADLRGHGRSGGPRSHVADFGHYVEDVEAVRLQLGLAPAETVVLGHSMGGLIAARYAQAFPENLSALVMLSPLLGIRVPIPKMTVAVGRVLSYVAPQVRFKSRVDPYHTTRNLDALERRLSDPLIDRSVTAGWFFAMRGALRSVWSEAGKLRVPLLVLQAGEDRIVDPAAIEPWLEQVASPVREFRMIPDSLHELLNEPDWETTAASIAEWLTGRFAPPESPLRLSTARS